MRSCDGERSGERRRDGARGGAAHRNGRERGAVEGSVLGDLVLLGLKHGFDILAEQAHQVVDAFVAEFRLLLDFKEGLHQLFPDEVLDLGVAGMDDTLQ